MLRVRAQLAVHGRKVGLLPRGGEGARGVERRRLVPGDGADDEREHGHRDDRQRPGDKSPAPLGGSRGPRQARPESLPRVMPASGRFAFTWEI